MSELADARLAVSVARAALESALRALRTAEMATAVWREPDGSLRVIDPDVPGNREAFDRLEAAKAALAAGTEAVSDAQAAYDAAGATYVGLAAQAPLFPSANGDPVLLLPVRVEAVFGAEDDGSPVLRIRVYPDDVHVDSHEEGLTERERAAGVAYWRAVGAAADDPTRRGAAWQALVGATGGERASWVRTVSTPTGADPTDPSFPEVADRSDAWTRAATTVLLPDRFEFSAYRDGALTWRHSGGEIPDRLALGIAPSPGAAGDDGLLDPASRWLVDFAEAVEVGMAVSVPLAAADDHFDLLTVVGVSDQDAATGAARVEAALAAHAHTSGVALLPVRTPTNNTPSTRSAWRSRGAPLDPDTADRRRAAFDPTGEQDSARLARALGIDGSGTLAGAADPAESDAELLRALHRLQADTFAWSRVWAPADEIDRTTGPTAAPWYEAASTHFADHVRGRGPLPLVRIGRQPYGVLPVSSSDLWVADSPTDAIPPHVSSFESAFVAQVDRALQVGEGADQDAVLLDLLSREGSPRRIAGWPHFVSKTDPRTAAVGSVPVSVALPWQEPVERADPGGPPREPEWIEAFPDTMPAELRAFLDARPLAQLLVLFDEALSRMRATHQPPVPDELTALYEPIAATMWQLRQPPTQSVFYTHAAGVHNALYHRLASGPALPDAVDRAVAAAEPLRRLFVGYVDLEDEAVADLVRLERLFRETLEPLSHRVDAWVTSLASRRLTGLRETAPRGVRTGAYGWLTDVEPFDPRPSREGYVVTPSLHHATTAAVLRSGWQAHSDRGAFAVDIQSTRARRATAMVEGIRAGQTVGALLGYQLERALHDARLDQYVAGFRRAYPLAPLVAPDAPDGSEARIAIGARNVVDGQALRRDRPRLAQDPAALAAAAAADVAGNAAVLLRAIAELDETFDAVGDLLLAESVHQLVGGSPLRAGLAADAAGRGHELPAEYDVLSTPRSGVALTHHVGVLLPDALAPGWSDDRPLVKLEPGVEAWLRARLGPAEQWGVPTGEQTSPCALDLLVAPPATLKAELLAQGPADPARLDELALLLDRLRATLASATPLSVVHLRPGAASAAGGYDLSELDSRVRPWLAELRAAAHDLSSEDATTTTAAVERLATLGVTTGPRDATDAVDRTRAVLAAVPLDEPPPVPDPTTDAADSWLAAIQDRASRLLHPAVRLTPRLTAELPAGPEPAPAPDAVLDWLRDMASVRPAVETWQDALVAGELLAASPSPTFHVVQPAAEDGTRSPWFADSAPAGDPSSKLALVLQSDGVSTTDRGLVVDSWTEVAPRPPGEHGPEETVGVAFDYDRPGARAPQSLLIAVPPDPARGWCVEDLHGCVEETLRLARVRTLDLVDLPELGTVLPIPYEGV
ncbi:hypothetical protein [Nocardioides sp. 503]|uniref:hypothetical protein n=1 Tax=Nocardioides sp. 503 TaxID=2508326 RepID=UPI00106F3540|nr:hypothetical protein [Nocardioides sp. 503]